jgi:hypothetical protein
VLTTKIESKQAGRRAHALFQSSIHGPWEEFVWDSW